MNEFHSLIWDNVDFLPKRKQNECAAQGVSATFMLAETA